MKMSKLFLLVLLNCLSPEKEIYEVKKIEPMNFKLCFKSFLDSKNFFKKESYALVKSCDFFIFTEIDSKTRLEKDVLEYYKDDDFLKKNEFSCEKLFIVKEEIRKISFFCYRESKITNVNFQIYNDFDFLNPVFLIAVDLINERKIMFINFDSDKYRKNELKEFDKLLSFASQNYSYRKIFYLGKFHLKEKNLTDSFVNSLSFPFILNNLNKEESNTKVFTDSYGVKKCNSKLEIVTNFEFYSLTCEL